MRFNPRSALKILAIAPLAFTIGLGASPERAPRAPEATERGGRGHGPLGALRGALASLDLSEAQKDKIKAALEARRPAFESLRERRHEARRKLRELTEAPNRDLAAIGAATVELTEGRKEIRAQMQLVRSDIEEILTPDQRTKLDGYLAALRNRFGHRRHGG